jgi:hypothetical protein
MILIEFLPIQIFIFLYSGVDQLVNYTVISMSDVILL